MTHGYSVGDLVELASETDWNPSLFRIREVTDEHIILGQLSDISQEYAGIDTCITIADPEEMAELVPATAERLAIYPNITR